MLPLLVIGCTHAKAPEPARTCIATTTVSVVDEAGQPVRGARVHSVAEFMSGGPSRLPETMGPVWQDGAVVVTDARGTATICGATLPQRYEYARGASIVVDHLAWPRARVPIEQKQITIGPPRDVTVQVPAACAEARVRAVSFAGESIGRARRDGLFTLGALGPWPYWVRSDSCNKSFVRVLDPRTAPTVFVMDHDEASVDHAEFAGGTLTIRAFRDPAELVTQTLDDAGHAIVALPASPRGTFCMTLRAADRCMVTFVRSGEAWTPSLYADRGDFLKRDCLPCD